MAAAPEENNRNVRSGPRRIYYRDDPWAPDWLYCQGGLRHQEPLLGLGNGVFHYKCDYCDRRVHCHVSGPGTGAACFFREPAH